MVPTEQRLQVEAVLRDLLIGQRFCRAHFYGTPILYLWGPPKPELGPWYSTDDDDAVNIWVEGGWQFFDSEPPSWPQGEEDLPARSIGELVGTVCDLHRNDIVDVRLGLDSPHLILTFDNGRMLFINGHHDQYERWQLYAGSGQRATENGQLLIMAAPGDELAMWLPKNYRSE